MITTTKPQILLVEDDALARKMGVIILADLNCQVTTAENGQAAIEKSKHHAFDLIFIDIGLPDMNGLVVLDKIRKTASPNQNTSIVILTAQKDEKYQKESTKIGASEYVVKPLSLESAKMMLVKYHCQS